LEGSRGWHHGQLSPSFSLRTGYDVREGVRGGQACDRSQSSKLSKSFYKTLDDKAGRVKVGVGRAEGGDETVSSAFGGAEVHEEDLVFDMVDDAREERFQFGFFAGCQVTLEDGKLEMIPEIAAGFENLSEAFGVADVVANKVSAAHGEKDEL
jgi:hypothetical protein